MPKSRRWRRLDRSVRTLRTHFLPRSFHPLGEYPRSARVHLHTRAFLILSHAEIECFLEEWAKDIARKSEQAWINHGRVSMPLAFLVATSEVRISVPQNQAASQPDAPAQFKTTLNATLQNYYKLIRDNHGVKETNVLALFTPLGAPATAFGSTLLPDLDSFGTLRGELAHLSARAIRTVPDAETEYRKVLALVNDLTVLDDWLVKCRAGIR